MREAFLHYIWEKQHFNHSNLAVSGGGKILVKQPGSLNPNAGPDFLHANIQIDGLDFFGHVEIHVKAVEWKTHKHHLDPAYDGVILHVVWEADYQAIRHDGTPILTLELKERVDPRLLRRSAALSENIGHFPCSFYLERFRSAVVPGMAEKALKEQIQLRVNSILRQYGTIDDWEEIAYRMLGRAYGGKVNADAFDHLTTKIPLKILRRHSGNLFQLEAILFGVSGLFHGHSRETYVAGLQQEFRFLQHKYGLGVLEPVEWKFSRMRPPGFPTLRIAQFAALMNCSSNLFSLLINTEEPGSLEGYFRQKPSNYWQNHYRFGILSSYSGAIMGKATFHHILINTVIPLRNAYFLRMGGELELSWLDWIRPENNKVIRWWKAFDINVESARTTQGLYALWKLYCHRRKCHYCKVGQSILDKG